VLAVHLDPAATGDKGGLDGVVQDRKTIVLPVQDIRTVVRRLLADLFLTAGRRLKADNVVIGAEHAHQRRHRPLHDLHQLLADDLGASVYIGRRQYARGIADVERVRLGSIRRQFVIDANTLRALVVDDCGELGIGHG
jgi:hypothetical protein